MSNRAKRRAAERKRLERALDPSRNMQSPEETPMAILSGWSGSDHSQRRGYIMWHPTGDTRRELPAYSDQELRKRSHWLYQNSGIARRIVRGRAQMLGWLTPQPNTPDDAWNELVFANFQARAGSPYSYDAKGRLDFFSGQVAINTTRGKDGRLLGVLTEGPGAAAQMAFYEAHQIRGMDGQNGWEQGVLLSKFDRHLAYALAAPKDPGKITTVGGRDSIYFENWDAMGRIHGLPTLAHAAAHMLDLVEIDSATKHNIKVASEMGIVVENENGPVLQLGNGSLVGVGGFKELTVNEPVKVDDGNGGTTTENREVVKNLSVERVLAQGGIPDLPKGKKVKVIYDDRPGPNREAFHERIVEHCILGTDVPAAALYKCADLTGPGMRYTMGQIQRWVTLEHRRMAQEAQRFYVYHVAKEIKAGRLPAGPPDWWNQVIWLGLPDPTIDAGRDGQLTITRLEAGLTTWGDEWAQEGQFGKRKLRERIREFCWAKAETAAAAAEFGVEATLGEIIPRFQMKTVAAAA